MSNKFFKILFIYLFSVNSKKIAKILETFTKLLKPQNMK
jgi:hypothetical protein